MKRSSSLAMGRYSIEPRSRKFVKGHGYLLWIFIKNNYWTQDHMLYKLLPKT